MSNVSQWETSAPNNNAAPPDGAPEGMAANTVNDTMREMMAAVARWYQDTNGSLVTGGAGNAYTLSTNNNNSSLTDLPLVVFVANRANSGAATLNVDGLGAKSLRFGGVALAAGVLQEDVAYIAIYNAEDDAFDIVGYPTKDASEITTGELDDDRLSDNVPLKNAENEWTRLNVIRRTVNQSGLLNFEITDAGEDEKLWGLRTVSSGTVLQFGTRTDAGAFGTDAFQITRDGTAVTEVELNGDELDFNGNADISGTLTVGGTISGNGSGLTNLNASNLSSGTVPDARLPSEMSAKDFATTLGSIRIGGGAGNYRTYNFTARSSQATWYFDRSIVEYLEFRRHENGEGFSSPFRFDFMDDSLSVAGDVTVGGSADISGTLVVGGAATFSNDVTVGGTLAVDGAVRTGTAATSTSSTLAAGQIHHRSANTTVPSMNAGQWVAVQNTSTSSITLSQGAGVTLELGGTTMTGNRTLLAKGFAFIYFRANGVGVVHGSGVS